MKISKITLPVCLSVLLGTIPVLAQPAQQPANRPMKETMEKMEKKTMMEAKMVAPDAKAIEPIKVGDHIPNVTVKTTKGEDVKLMDALEGKPSVLIFYRGGWCPYCNAHLADLARINPELTKAGVKLVGISPDKPEKEVMTAEKKEIPYTLLSDSDHKAMTAFGVAFKVDETTIEKYKGFGLDLSEHSGNKEKVLPVPSVFVVDGNGIVKHVHANPDYTKRMSSQEVLEAAKNSVEMKMGDMKMESKEVMEKKMDGMKEKSMNKMEEGMKKTENKM